MNEIKGVRLKCERSVDVVELSIIVSHIFIQLGPFTLAKKAFPEQQMIVLKAKHSMDVKKKVFFY